MKRSTNRKRHRPEEVVAKLRQAVLGLLHECQLEWDVELDHWFGHRSIP